MKLLELKSRVTLFLGALIVSCSLVACAGNPATDNCPDNSRVNQSFSFDTQESPDIEILDYFYGTPNCPSITNPKEFREQGKCLQRDSSYGPLRRYENLYVKWRIKHSGQVYEDAVDLRHRLPTDMTNHELHFTVKQTKLYVYLITPERRPVDMLPNGPKETQHLKTLTIYPDQPE